MSQACVQAPSLFLLERQAELERLEDDYPSPGQADVLDQDGVYE